jgi:L-2,4-diaminobutyrate decarboxylase
LHRAADRVADYFCSLEDRAIFPTEAAAPQQSLLPEIGEPLTELFDSAADWAIENAVHVGHSGYVGHMDSGVAAAGILGDFLASALNQNLLAYELAPGATLLEKRLIRLFNDLAGLGPHAGGIFTTGGTTANLTALLLARNAAVEDASNRGLQQGQRLCVLASADAHYSIAKACAVLGIGSENVVPIPVAGPQRRFDPAALAQVNAQALEQGLHPIAVVATAGTTSCGAIDPIHAAADFCSEHGLWLHVDAAHGGALLTHRQEKLRLAGIERADSITIDPHKWLCVPKSAGMLLVAQEEKLVTAHYEAAYLDRFTPHGDALPVSQGRRALDGSRRFDALKVWMTLRHCGRDGLERLIGGRLQLTQKLHQSLAEHDFFMPSHLPDMNVQVFQPRDSALLRDIEASHRLLEAEGRFWTSYTRLEGQPQHRMVLINPGTQGQDLTTLLNRLTAIHQQLSSAPESTEHLSAKGRSVPPTALLHSSPAHRSKDGSQGSVVDEPPALAIVWKTSIPHEENP